MFQDAWQDQAHQLWHNNERQQAVNCLLKILNENPESPPRIVGLQLVYYVFLIGDLAAAEVFLRRLIAFYPQDGEILENLGVCLSRQGKHDEAVSWFQAAAEHQPDSPNLWDGLAHSYSSLGHWDQARQAGRRSLALKDQATTPLPGWELPACHPERFLRDRGNVNVICFSLWGHNLRYLRGALRNVLLIPEIYPHWTPRFYVDDSVPSELIQQITQLGAEVFRMPLGQSIKDKLTWRFQVANDSKVARFLVRDCDSVVNLRESHAVDAWIKSDRYFHVMRDWWTHTDPVLAGMWGGVAGVLPPLEPLLKSYVPKARETPNIDQWFLRDYLWDAIRQSALVHDRCYGGSDGSCAWPDPDPEGTFHVGQNEAVTHREQQIRWLSPWIDASPWLREGYRLNVVSEVSIPSPIDREENSTIQLSLVRGFYINLDSATDRRRAMDHQLHGLGLTHCYSRFTACEASLEEAQSRGLRSAGELGIWRSLLALLNHWLAEDPPEHDLLHILEDDAILDSSWPEFIAALMREPVGWDLILSDSFLTVDLYLGALRLLRSMQAGHLQVGLLDGGCYLGCTASMLLNRAGAIRLLNGLEQIFKQQRLAPVDMALRGMIRSSGLRALITIPFLTTISTDFDSTIQGFRSDLALRSQGLDLYLRRMLYNSNYPDPVASRSEFSDALAFLQSNTSMAEQQNLLADLIAIGRRQGWLINY
jgi:GR25 family glycosyltransferase involved in LPS biosynthesis